MRKRTPFLISAFVTVCMLACACSQQATEPPQPESLDGAATHVFKTTPQGDLRLHVFSPAEATDDEMRPGMVFFFGGGFRRGTVEQFVPQATHLAKRGMVGIVADYRVSGRHGTGIREAFADARSAIHWVRSHASELGIDPDRIAAGGGSSGGSIAWGTAILEEAAEIDGVSFRPNALVQFNPGTLNLELGSGLPPAVVYQGTEDTVTPYEPARQFCEEYERRGNRCRFVGFEGAEHRFFNPDVEDGRWYRETVLDMDRFLTDLGYLPAPPAEEVEWPLP